MSRFFRSKHPQFKQILSLFKRWDCLISSAEKDKNQLVQDLFKINELKNELQLKIWQAEFKRNFAINN